MQREVRGLFGQDHGAIQRSRVDRDDRKPRDRRFLDRETSATRRRVAHRLEDPDRVVPRTAARLEETEAEERLQLLPARLPLAAARAAITLDRLVEIALRPLRPEPHAAGGQKLQKIGLGLEIAPPLDCIESATKQRDRLRLPAEPAEDDPRRLARQGEVLRALRPRGHSCRALGDPQRSLEPARLDQSVRLPGERARTIRRGGSQERRGPERAHRGRVQSGIHEGACLTLPQTVAPDPVPAGEPDRARPARGGLDGVAFLLGLLRRAHRPPGGALGFSGLLPQPRQVRRAGRIGVSGLHPLRGGTVEFPPQRGIHPGPQLLRERARVRVPSLFLAVREPGGHALLGCGAPLGKVESSQTEEKLLVGIRLQDRQRFQPGACRGGEHLEAPGGKRLGVFRERGVSPAFPRSRNQQRVRPRRRAFGRLEEPLHPLVGDGAPGGPRRHRADRAGVEPGELDAPQRRHGSGVGQQFPEDGMRARAGTHRGDDLQRRPIAFACDAVEELRGGPRGGVRVIEHHEHGRARRRGTETIERSREVRIGGHHLPAFEDRLGLEPAEDSRLPRPRSSLEPDDPRPRGRIERRAEACNLLFAPRWRPRHEPRRTPRQRLDRETGPARPVEPGERLRGGRGPRCGIGLEHFFEPHVETGEVTLGKRRPGTPPLGHRKNEALEIGARGGHRRTAVHRLEQDGSKREEVRPGRSPLVSEQLGRHVRQRSFRPVHLERRSDSLLGETEVHHHEAATELRAVAYQEIARLEVAVDQAEIVKERERAERLDGEIREERGTLVRDRVHDAPPLNELEGESRQAGLGRPIELVDLDEIRVLEPREHRELAP